MKDPEGFIEKYLTKKGILEYEIVLEVSKAYLIKKEITLTFEERPFTFQTMMIAQSTGYFGDADPLVSVILTPLGFNSKNRFN